MQPDEVDTMLTVLRKHRVLEFEGNGMRVRLIAEAMFAEPEPAAKSEPQKPELGAVEPMRYDVADVLFGAK